MKRNHRFIYGSKKANETTSNTEPYTEREAKATLTQVYKQEPREPWAAPTNDIGLTKELDDYLMASAHFARDAGGVLYVFKEGVYRPTGEDYIKCEVKAWCMNQGRTKSWNPELPQPGFAVDCCGLPGALGTAARRYAELSQWST